MHVLPPQVHQREEGDSWVSYRPVALFNAEDLEGEALEGLIQKRLQAEGVGVRPEPERLAAAEAVLSRWPVPVLFGGDRVLSAGSGRIQLPGRAPFHSAYRGLLGRRLVSLAWLLYAAPTYARFELLIVRQAKRPEQILDLKPATSWPAHTSAPCW